MHGLFPSGFHVNIARNHAWCYSRWQTIALYFALLQNHVSPLYPPLVAKKKKRKKWESWQRHWLKNTLKGEPNPSFSMWHSEWRIWLWSGSKINSVDHQYSSCQYSLLTFHWSSWILFNWFISSMSVGSSSQLYTALFGNWQIVDTYMNLPYGNVYSNTLLLCITSATNPVTFACRHPILVTQVSTIFSICKLPCMKVLCILASSSLTCDKGILLRSESYRDERI